MSLILDALRKARESRGPATPDPYLIVGGKKFFRQRVITKKSVLAALGGCALLGIVTWFLLSPKAPKDRPTTAASGEAITPVQTVQSQALETRPAEQAQSVQTQAGKTQAVPQPEPQPTIDATTPLELRPPQAATTEQPKAVETPSIKAEIPKPIPMPAKAAILPPEPKAKKVNIPKTGEFRTAARTNYEAITEKPAAAGEETSTYKIPSKQIAISESRGRKQLEQERFHLQLASASHKNKQFQKALQEYQRVLKLNPSNNQARNNLGLVYKDMGDLDRAATEYMQLIAIEPNNAKAYNNLGTIYYLQGRFPEAVQEFTKALAIDGNNVESYVNLALTYKRQGRTGEAVQVFEHVLSIDTQLAEAHYNLALLMEEMGDVSNALLHFQKFVDLSEGKHVNLTEEVRRHIEKLSFKKQRQIILK